MRSNEVWKIATNALLWNTDFLCWLLESWLYMVKVWTNRSWKNKVRERILNPDIMAFLWFMIIQTQIALERDAAASPHLRIDRCHESAPLTSLTPWHSIVIPFLYNPNKRERERERDVQPPSERGRYNRCCIGQVLDECSHLATQQWTVDECYGVLPVKYHQSHYHLSFVSFAFP